MLCSVCGTCRIARDMFSSERGGGALAFAFTSPGKGGSPAPSLALFALLLGLGWAGQAPRCTQRKDLPRQPPRHYPPEKMLVLCPSRVRLNVALASTSRMDFALERRTSDITVTDDPPPPPTLTGRLKPRLKQTGPDLCRFQLPSCAMGVLPPCEALRSCVLCA